MRRALVSPVAGSLPKVLAVVVTASEGGTSSSSAPVGAFGTSFLSTLLTSLRSLNMTKEEHQMIAHASTNPIPYVSGALALFVSRIVRTPQ